MDSAFHHGWTELKEIHASDKQWNTALGARMHALAFARAHTHTHTHSLQ